MPQFNTFEDLLKSKSQIISGEFDLPRSKGIQQKYSKALISIRYKSMEVLKKSVLMGKKYNLQFNKYPYDLPADTVQYVLWFEDYNIKKSEINKILKKIFLEMGWSSKDVICFENPIPKRSLPQIRHYHLYVKKELTYGKKF